MASSGEFGQSAPVSSTISSRGQLVVPVPKQSTCRGLNKTHCLLSLLEMDIFQYISRSKQDAPYGVGDATVVSKIAGRPCHVMCWIRGLKIPMT